jgi:hypothetical protein
LTRLGGIIASFIDLILNLKPALQVSTEFCWLPLLPGRSSYSRSEPALLNRWTMSDDDGPTTNRGHR